MYIKTLILRKYWLKIDDYSFEAHKNLKCVQSGKLLLPSICDMYFIKGCSLPCKKQCTNQLAGSDTHKIRPFENVSNSKRGSSLLGANKLLEHSQGATAGKCTQKSRWHRTPPAPLFPGRPSWRATTQCNNADRLQSAHVVSSRSAGRIGELRGCQWRWALKIHVRSNGNKALGTLRLKPCALWSFNTLSLRDHSQSPWEMRIL